MGKVWRVSLLVFVVLVLGVSSALAAQFSFDGKVFYGTYLSRVWESERYGSVFPMVVLDGTLAFDSGLKFSAEAICGTSDYITEDLAGYYLGNGSYSPYVFGSLKADVAWQFSDNLALLVGYSTFKGALDDDNSETDHDWYYTAGSGYKFGFETGFQLSDKLGVSLKYAYLPRVYAMEYYEGGFDYDYEWMGVGHEYDLKASYALSDNWGFTAGLKSDLYQGFTGCCGQGADLSIGGVYAGAKFTF